MLNLYLYFPRVGGAYQIYTVFFLGNMSKIAINCIWPCTLTCVFYWLHYWTALYFFTMNHSRFIILLVTYHFFKSNLWKKETIMFYVDTVITFSVFLELLWGSNLIIHYNLNIFSASMGDPFWYLCAVIWKMPDLYS